VKPGVIGKDMSVSPEGGETDLIPTCGPQGKFFFDKAQLVYRLAFLFSQNLAALSWVNP